MSFKDYGDFTLKLDEDAVLRITGGDVARALEILAQVGEESAKRHAPVRTGHLRRSITHELVRPGSLEQYAIVGTNVSYAVFQELGTRYHGAHPFLRPAMTDVALFTRSGFTG